MMHLPAAQATLPLLSKVGHLPSAYLPQWGWCTVKKQVHRIKNNRITES